VRISRVIAQAARAGNRFTLQPAVPTIARGIKIEGFEEWVEELVSDSEAHIRLLIKGLESKAATRLIRAQSKVLLNTIKVSARQAAKTARIWQEDEEFGDLVWGYRYVTSFDDRVRPEHAKLDKLELPRDHPFWLIGFPPNDWNCRCSVVTLTSKPKSIRTPPKIEIPKLFRFNPGVQLGS